MSLAACRERFPILAEATYRINHSLGAMPAADTAGRVRAYLEDTGHPGAGNTGATGRDG
jgi:hypothetical protein